MLIFLDSANLLQITQAVESGLITGVTTNPSLLAQQPEPEATIRQICALVPGPVSLQVLARETSEIVAQGRQLAAIAPNAVVKIPLTPVGLRACSQLRAENIPVNITLCFSIAHALLAARAGATYVSPFIGRLEDAGESGEQFLSELAALFELHGLKTQILAASIRNRSQFETAALCGAHIATVPFGVFQTLYEHPLLTQGLKRFSDDGEPLQVLFA